MPGEVLNMGSSTRTFMEPLLRTSKPTMVREWPIFGQIFMRVEECLQGFRRDIPGCWK